MRRWCHIHIQPPPDTTKELWKAVVPFGSTIDRSCVCPFFFRSSHPRAVGFSERVIGSIQNARFSSIHTRIVLSKYCAFTNGLLRSLHIERSENRPYSLFPGTSGYPWSLKTRLTRCRQAQSSMISSGQCPYGDVAQAIECAPDRSPATDISQAALTNFWSRLGYLVEVRICT